ncbi:phage terminase large subunit [Phreatobacter oligotrophus]|uniref:Putative phage terminase large subunit-like protein n=1 Tax=Phreatobacter oligotrophus TaxID=1122261 RepID=A0A2T4YY44_9HYPH|nr:phage terminase large subunit [Phreatobacter oligotrophus]PTM51469.1 putative phage terminase large subunit-like protein [Phreatobacter oligotrophus]
MTTNDPQAPLPDEALIALARRSFAVFVRVIFPILNPGVAYQHNWHVDAIAHALEKVWLGETKRLIITLPPRHLKSLITSVAFPAFLLGHDPTRRILCLSYAQDLATKFHNEFRQLIEHPLYQLIFAGARIGPWKDTGQEVILAGNGSRFAGSVGGTLTGRGGDILIFDDPLKAQDAHSDVKRASVNEWMSGTAMSRLDDKANGAVVLVMQRLHVHDPVGTMLARAPEEWEVLDLPAIADADRIVPIGPKETYLWPAGEALHPAREPVEVLDRIRRDLGTAVFEAQYLQRPSPPEGNILRRSWLRYYDPLPDLAGARIIQSWDTASKVSLENDYSVCVTLAELHGVFYVLDVARAKLTYPALRLRAIELAKRHRPQILVIEEAGVGVGLVQDLRRERLNPIGITPRESKDDRVRFQSPKFESGRVLLPSRAPWATDLVAELLGFPHGAHDDQVDALCQALAASDRPQVRVSVYDRFGRLIYSTGKARPEPLQGGADGAASEPAPIPPVDSARTAFPRPDDDHGYPKPSITTLGPTPPRPVKRKKDEP